MDKQYLTQDKDRRSKITMNDASIAESLHTKGHLVGKVDLLLE
jgi:hypothetical protein